MVRIPLRTWEYSIFSENLIFSKIADRNLIDPTLRKSVRYHIKSDVETGNYDLQISNANLASRYN
jgi:hypothetical protein